MSQDNVIIHKIRQKGWNFNKPYRLHRREIERFFIAEMEEGIEELEDSVTILIEQFFKERR